MKYESTHDDALSSTTLMDLIQLVVNSTYYVGILSVLIAKLYIPQLLKYGKTWERSTNYWINLTCSKANFVHFYLISTSLSLFNLFAFKNLLTVCVFVHSIRRLYECVSVTRWGQSRIHITHYLVGLWFYTLLNLGIMVNNGQTRNSVVSSVLFIIFTLDQMANHEYLSKLKKYCQPRYGLFKYVCCAHYFDEVMIYFSFFLMNSGSRTTLAHSLFWIIVNLGTSSYETGNWYLQKFGSRSRWYFIPFVF